MDNKFNEHTEDRNTVEQRSAVKAVISWLVQAERDYRATQTMIEKTNTER